MRSRLLKFVCLVFILIFGTLFGCGGGTSTPPTSPSNPPAPPTTGPIGPAYVPNGTWTLVWADEFNGSDGSLPDSTKWSFDPGPGLYNGELEYYGDGNANTQIRNGNLVIAAKAESVGGRNYTSARMNSKGKFEQAYGRFEARMKLPIAQGMWPAFWMMGNDSATNYWPACGEIDVMELIGSQPGTVFGTIHGPSAGDPYSIGDKYQLPSGTFADAYHVFSAEWEPNVIRFYVDNNLYKTLTPADVNGGTWPFQHPFYMILNLAVGGNWPGAPDQTTHFPQEMLVDYVRVYQRR